MLKYLSHVLELQKGFKTIHFSHIGRAKNAHADALAALGSACNELGGTRTITLGEIAVPSFEQGAEDVMTISVYGPSWMELVVSFLRDQTLPSDRKEAHRIRCQSASYFLSPTGQLYRRTYVGPDLRMLHDAERKCSDGTVRRIKRLGQSPQAKARWSLQIDRLLTLLVGESTQAERSGHPFPLTIVFVERKTRSDEVAEALVAQGLHPVALHGGRSQLDWYLIGRQ
ncbi:hypothetical protein Vadar_011133 [Vaccinium darrowii]|uniref:Uncharacterized protein n=1 Tax=Vaccinium darrowii TaxID=229202 RepID=A0ACB7X930_9ERIC|nr:hypothetical protein Vadar_011133 [Vaccinium darrowii]